MSNAYGSPSLRLVVLFATCASLSVFGSKSSTRSESNQPTTQEPEPSMDWLNCDIDGSWKGIEDCSAETIIAQYKDRYDLTVVLGGGVYWQVVSGQYVNDQYGYTVDIPDGVEALCTPPPMPWHGFFVDVAKELELPANTNENHGGFVWANWNAGVHVEAYYNSLEYGSAEEAVEARLGDYKEDHADDLIILIHERTKLRRVPASRYLVQFVDVKSGEAIVAEGVIAIRGDEGIIYSIGLTTTALRYSQDEKVLRTLLNGLRFTRPE